MPAAVAVTLHVCVQQFLWVHPVVDGDTGQTHLHQHGVGAGRKGVVWDCSGALPRTGRLSVMEQGVSGVTKILPLCVNS